MDEMGQGRKGRREKPQQSALGVGKVHRDLVL